MPTPRGDVAVSWTFDEGKFTMAATVPSGATAEVVLPLSHFENPIIHVDGKESAGTIRLEAGQHCIDIIGKLRSPRQE